MKLHFESDLDYQREAIQSVCDLFRGQETSRTEFTVTRGTQNIQTEAFQSDLGTGNHLTISDETLLENLHRVQLRNGLEPSTNLDSGNFTVEMETGTGKTYVYLRTIFELNRDYGFSKFVIVVPSVAIKEGVYETLKNAEDHFRSLYSGVPFSYFLYDSGRLDQVRTFSTSSAIQIMLVTVGAINKKDVNNIYGKGANEQTGGEKPIDLIKAANPILIIDEPQSVDGGLEGRGKEALDAMNPLCTLRYSATHTDKHHPVFCLGPIESYERKLVKQIEVASATVEASHNTPYLKLLSVGSKRGVVTARVEIDIQTKTNVRREEVTLQDGDFLEKISGRSLYANHQVGEIRAKKGDEFLELRLPDGERYLALGETHGDGSASAVEREMIRRTIREHLDKEKKLRPRGIKVLSLFFVPSVDSYRVLDTNRNPIFDAQGNPLPGEYARIFEEEYKRLRGHPDYRDLFPPGTPEESVANIHKGYFSVDRKKVGNKIVEVFKETRGNTKSDDETYNLIMREKGRLLELENPLRFIFSHSALKEGWDNPNVFQICALREMPSERQRRQTIGRGLRLCVNQHGDRVRDVEVNTLTVIANESYEDFANRLQSEIEIATGIRFGVVEKHAFAMMLGMEISTRIWAFLQEKEWLDKTGTILPALRKTLQNQTFALPDEFSGQQGIVEEVLRKLAGKINIKNADARKPVGLHKAVLYGMDFQLLWDRIKYQTTYRIDFDANHLIEDCIRTLKALPPIGGAHLQWRKADLKIGKEGISAKETSNASVPLAEEAQDLPDILTNLQDKTLLTRASLVRILTQSDRLDEFKRNPQEFIDQVCEAINRRKRLAFVNGIQYHKLGSAHYYDLKRFEETQTKGYLENLLSVKHSIYDQVVYESETERSFAEELDRNQDVRLYVKLPRWFEIPTPVGAYIPDWAVLIEKDNTQRLYFVVETKSTLAEEQLRGKENAKIECGKAHFKALASGDSVMEPGVEYHLATNVDQMMAYAFEPGT